ncbi:hypothetical protein [Legionella sp. W05-934-2]|jgi:hypothetical protein|uniref:hypothetical protein n=1 Tax=Legionella sp. W05-934-2 TaxID=1198649 RepID=UPI0034634F21
MGECYEFFKSLRGVSIGLVAAPLITAAESKSYVIDKALWDDSGPKHGELKFNHPPTMGIVVNLLGLAVCGVPFAAKILTESVKAGYEDGPDSV